MSDDPVLRLTALHEDDPRTAIDRFFANVTDGTSMDVRKSAGIIEDAVALLVELVEGAICTDRDEVVIATSSAELLILALKSRRLPTGRPRLTERRRTLRAATIHFGRKRAQELRLEGIPAGKADEQAAREAAEQGGSYGDVAAWSTVLKEMKVRGKKPAD